MSGEEVSGRRATTSEDELRALSLTTRSADEHSEAPPEAPAPGARLVDPGRYEVIGEHGRGGLGVVTRVHDRELGRDVAVKELLSRGVVSERRFAREARITARLEHPGIVPVYEAGRWPNGTPFYAMKLVSGRPLRELIAERKTVDERIGLLHHVIAVADAMAYAHGRNVIHRDLKPANVIVGEFGETVVIDWGLAKDLSDGTTIGAGPDGDGDGDDELTKAGSVLGTPAYMAPEQERGEAVDQRADVFAIGAMLWELCSLHKVPPVDRRQRRRLLRRAGIDDDLIAILDRSIDRDPARRYADAGALAADLKAFKAGARIAARSYSLPALLAHWTRRNRMLALGLAVFLVVLVVAVVALTWLYRTSTENASLARRNAAVAQDRLVRSYVEQGRRALLDESYSSALPLLTQAAHHGDASDALRFMIQRAAGPIEVELLRLPALSPRAWQASFSRDGERLLTGDDGGGRMWDARSGQLLFSMPHADVVIHAKFTAGERRVVTVGLDGAVKIWSAQNGALEHLMTRTGGAHPYNAGAVSPDGALVATGLEGRPEVDLWSVAGGTLVSTLAIKPFASERTLSFSANGRWLAVGSRDRAQIFEVASRKLVTELDTPGLQVLVFDPTGPRVVTGTTLGDVSIWQVPDGRRVQHLLQGGEVVCDLAVSPDGELVAAGFLRSTGTEIVWRARSGAVQSRLMAHEHGNVRVVFDPSSKLLASGGPKGRVTISDAMSGIPLFTIQGSSRSIGALSFGADSRRLAGAALDGTVRIWDLTGSYRISATREIDQTCGTTVNQDIDQRYLAVSCRGRTTQVFDTASARVVADLPAVTEVPGSVRSPLPAIAADGTRAAIARNDRAELYELPSRRLVRTILLPANVTVTRFAAHGHVLVIGSSDGTVDVSDEEYTLFRGRVSTSTIDAVAVLPHGQLLLADAEPRLRVLRIADGGPIASFESPVRARALRTSDDGGLALAIPEISHLNDPALFDLRGQGFVAPLRGHTSQVYSARFVHGEREILTSSTDGTARLWDAHTGQPRQTLYATDGMLVDATISPDGKMVVTAGGDGNLRFWDLASGLPIWKLRAHGSFISEVQFRDGHLISRGSKGDLAMWSIPAPPASPDWLAPFDRLVRCGPLRFDEATGGLVAQTPCATTGP